ncbi:LacI family transcriptional regulator (plasmid) [Rhodococcus qingshengii]|uniref:LacI family DNA-binding transcriptional regulator n=1 Tax=Rhodococcus qingshengii TaxID=334542 RepID=UPI0007E57037|nr:LacI family DNA-binding transcriptional regulator [Rhodococcus qingshengii]BCF86342.1 LacI family transcriptional regulator [Rhodococcus qingshengii]
MASLMDVATTAAVSKSIASRVLSGDPAARVSEETRKRVLDAARELNYVPNHRARAFRFNRSGALGLIVPDVTNAVFAEMLTGVHAAAQAAGMTVLLGQVDDPDTGRHELEMLIKQGRVDGLVLQRREDFDDEQLRSMLAGQIPVVLVNSTLEGRVGSVALDDHTGVALATNHLIELGHRDIAHLAGMPHHDAARRRLEGFRTAMADAGLATREEWIHYSGWEADGGRRAMTELLSITARPTAVVVASVNAAIGALAAALRAGIRVPEELSLIAINDTWVTESVVPAITTVRMPLHELGRTAATMLVGSLDGEPLDDLVLTDPRPELIVRESTGTPRST